MQIDANEKPFGDILSVGQHTVPRFQRNYSWTEQNIQEYWDDLVSAGDSGHFLGSMVTAKNGPESSLIVDGQQRMTTTLIFLACLRDYYLKYNNKTGARGINNYLKFIDRDGNHKSRLVLNGEEENHRFQLCMSEECEANGSGKNLSGNILRNYQKFYELIGNKLDQAEAQGEEDEGESRNTPTLLSDARKTNELKNLRDAALNSRIVYVQVDTIGEAMTVYETLNDRGLSLTTLDLVKNEIFKHIPETAERIEEHSWAKIVENVNTSQIQKIDLEGFLGYHWNSKDIESRNDPIVAVKIRRSVENYIKAGGEHDVTARLILSEFHESSEILRIFGELLRSHGSATVWRGWARGYRDDKFQKISVPLYGILITHALPPMPTLLALFRKYKNDPHVINSTILARFLREIERLQLRWSLSNKGSTATVRRAWRSTAFDVSRAKTRNEIINCLKQFSEVVDRIIPSDKQFSDGIARLRSYNGFSADAVMIRYILGRVNSNWSGVDYVCGTHSSIEHIMSQSGKSMKTNRNVPVAKIGNLMLLPGEVNSRLPEDFSGKREDLRNYTPEGDRTLQEALTTGSWDISDMKERFDHIAAECQRIWPVSFSNS
ncbi:DUF262 domain-containing HNH endonuclease family protein [Rothia sp. BD8]|uniref:GmrSD restriction endonuclease domain-containing protein n=1 Tax=Rothia sp. BD8 TaxID=2953894 RepID=UPI00383F5010